MTYLVRHKGEFNPGWFYLTDPALLVGVLWPAPWMPNISRAKHFDTVEAAETEKAKPWLNLNGLGNRAEIVEAQVDDACLQGAMNQTGGINMASTDVEWSCTAAEDPFYTIAEPQTTMLYGFWADVEGNGSDTAKAVAEDYFDTGTWDEWFGEDDGAVVRIIITSPAEAVGTYEVEMQRVVKATARLLTEEKAR